MSEEDPFKKYLLTRGVTKTGNVELVLSDSDKEEKIEGESKPRQKIFNLSQLFSSRKKDRVETDSNKLGNVPHREQRFERDKSTKNAEISNFAEATQQLKDNIKKSSQKCKQGGQSQKKSVEKQLPLSIYIPENSKNYKPNPQSDKQQQQQNEKRLRYLKRKEEKAEEERKKVQKEAKRKSDAFKKFLSSVTTKSTEKTSEAKPISESQLNNISMFNKIQEQMMKQAAEDKKLPSKNVGLIYKKTAMQNEKIPISFLKLLFSYRFAQQFPSPQSKKVPNEFEDHTTYKKVFHYLIANQCIADLHLRMQKIGDGAGSSIAINLSNFRKNYDGFTQFHMGQFSRDPLKQNATDRQKFMLKNLSLSRNRLGLITNSKDFKLSHFGIPSPKNQRIYAFICMLITPESKEDLNSPVKGLTNIQIDNLDIIIRLNNSQKAYFYDLEKISTHLRQYLAVSNLCNTEVAPFIYTPSLIEQKHLDIIPEEQREQLEPILQKLKSEYNPTQYESIREMALRSSGIVLLQGPPGTGKTTTLMGLLAAEYDYLKNISCSEEKRKILICAPSNAAINHITKRLKREGLYAPGYTGMHFSNDGEQTQVVSSNLSAERVFPKILRVGIVDTDDPDILSVSLDDICDKKMHEAKSSNVKRNNMTTTQIKEKMISLSKQINKLKGRKDLMNWQIEKQTQSLKFQIKKYESLLFNFRKERIELKQTYNMIENKQFEDADIILTTLSSSGSEKMEKIRGYVGCLIIDQAAQSTEPNLLIPLQSGVRKILLIGDPYQLPSTTMSQDSSITLFNRSLFQRFLDNGVKPYFLNIQYRMAPLIREFPSNLFYSNRLIDAQCIDSRYSAANEQSMNEYQNNIAKIRQFFNRNSIFIDVKYGSEEFQGNSYRNIAECNIVRDLVLDFIRRTKLSIGVITPYQSQRRYLLKELSRSLDEKKQLMQQLKKYEMQRRQNKQKSDGSQSNLQPEEGQCPSQAQSAQPAPKADSHASTPAIRSLDQLLQQRVMINTVDSFQGQEKDIIIVSTVRSNSRNDIGFMKDQRRVNVALTRSRHLLIVVGHGDTIGSNETWNSYLEWSEGKRCYYQISTESKVKQVLGAVNKEYSNEAVSRVRHHKLSRDLRKLQREEIRREDFGLGLAKKKVKRYEPVQTTNTQQAIKQQINMTTQAPNINKAGEATEEKMSEELIEHKRVKEQEALLFEEANKRIKQLQQKIMNQSDNPYGNIF